MKLEEFIRTFADNVTKLELLVFFHDNPSTMDTLDSLSIWAGIPLDTIRDIANFWADNEILTREGAIFIYNVENQFQAVIEQVVQTYKSTRNVFRSELESIVHEKEKETQQHKRALQTEIGKTDILFETITEGVLHTTNDHEIVRFNRQFNDIFDEISDVDLGKKFSDTALPQKTKQSLIGLFEGGSGTSHMTVNDRHYEVTLSSIRNDQGEQIVDEKGMPAGQLWFFRDVSAQKELDEVKEELSRMITHDLRSPMTGIFTAFDLIIRQGEETLPEHLYKSCQLGRRTSQFILGMVNDLLDVHKIQDGKIPLLKTTLKVTQLITEASEQVSPLAQNRQITVNTTGMDENLTIHGDQQKLVRVLVNLMTNAVKYTQKGGIIDLICSVPDHHELTAIKGFNGDEKDRREFVQVAVKDNGYGIPPESLPFIFDKYYRVKQKKKFPVTGTGLGLHFCKLIVETHGGSIWATSKLKKGSCFSFILPLAQIPQ